MTKKIVASALALLAVLALVVLFTWVIEIHTVKGNEIGVKETWSGGVIQTPLTPKTYFLVPGLTQTVYNYDMSAQVFVMNNNARPEEYGQGRSQGAYTVQSQEGQDMDISCRIQWRRDPDRIIHLHQQYQDNIEERILVPVMQRVIKDQATQVDAVDAYSGPGLVQLQADIETMLQNSTGELASNGIIVDSFVVEGIVLDAEYIGEIRARQVAYQRELRANQEEQAALAEARRTEAEAQSDLNRAVVGAERDRQVQVLQAQADAEQRVVNAEAEAQQVVLAANAAAEQVRLAAEAERDAALLEAEGLLAVGQARAEAARLEYAAFGEPGAESYVRIQIANSLAEAHQNVRGYLPQDMTIVALGENYTAAVEAVMAGNLATQAAGNR